MRMYEIGHEWRPIPDGGLLISQFEREVRVNERHPTAGLSYQPSSAVLFSIADLSTDMDNDVAYAICRLVGCRFVSLIEESSEALVPNDHVEFAMQELVSVPFFVVGGVFDASAFVYRRRRLCLGRLTGAAIELNSKIVRRTPDDRLSITAEQSVYTVFVDSDRSNPVYSGNYIQAQTVMRHIAATPWRRTITAADIKRWADSLNSTPGVIGATTSGPQRAIVIPDELVTAERVGAFELSNDELAQELSEP